MDFNFCQIKVDELKHIINSIESDIHSHNPCFNHKLSQIKHIVKSFDDTLVSDDHCYYYGNDNISACVGDAIVNVKMLGKKSKPKYRCVCANCFTYLVSHGLAHVSTTFQ